MIDESYRRPGPMRPPVDDDLEELYEDAPCGQVSTLLDGTIVKVNRTLLRWLGYERADLTRTRRLPDLLAVGDRIYYETHLSPLLRMQGEVRSIALQLLTADGGRLPVLLTSNVKVAAEGRPSLIRHTIFEAGDRRAYEQELLRARRSAEHEQERLRHLAHGLQRSLLPAALPNPPGMRAAAHYHMASRDEVGGDFYDLFALPDGRWGFFLGDVSGKGVPAAATTATARYTLRAAAVYDPDPAAVLANLNTVLFQEYHSGRHRHCTVLFGILVPDGDGYTVTLAGGGHPAPMVLRADGSVQYEPLTGGALIGVLKEPRIVTRKLTLAPGDTLLLYTDGLIEARVDAAGERYGNNALLDFAGALAPSTAADTVAALVDLIASFPYAPDDDVAFMAMHLDPAASAPEARIARPEIR